MKRRSTLSLLALASVSALTLAACSSGEATAGGEGGGGGGEAATTFKIAFNQNAEHPQAQALTELGEKLSEATDGKYSVEVYPDELLGAQADTIEQVQSGTIEMAMVAGSLLESFNPDFSVVNLPYLYTSAEQQMAVLNDESITGELFDSLEGDNIGILAAYHGGVRNVYTTEGPVKTPADLAGQKIRVIGSDTNVKMMELMGGVGTPMDQGEVYTAIQSGVLDGAENNELVYSSMAHDEVAPFYSKTQHLMMPDMLIVNPTVLESMDDESRQALLDLVAESVDTELTLFGEAVDKATAEAEEAGATFTEVDVDAFREAVLPLHEQLVTSETQRKVYDAIMAAD
jgi:tripartite ATP-independent transporter DctP family solute receptor